MDEVGCSWIIVSNVCYIISETAHSSRGSSSSKTEHHDERAALRVQASMASIEGELQVECEHRGLHLNLRSRFNVIARLLRGTPYIYVGMRIEITSKYRQI